MKALTFNQYRLINMVMLAVVFSVIETMIVKGAYVWFPELAYTLSLAVIFISLEIMRWGVFGAFAALVSAAVYCAASGASPEQWLIYCVGNLFAVLGFFFLKLFGSENVRKNPGLSMLYVVVVFLLIQIGRWAVSTALGNDPRLFFQFFATDLLCGVFGVVVVLILRTADGLFENQKSYLIRLEEERKAKENDTL